MTPVNVPVLLKNFTADELHAQLAHIGVTPRLARLLQRSAVQHNALPQPTANGFSAKILDQVRPLTLIPHLTLVEKIISPQDGFAKYLFRGGNADTFEAVRIPLLHRPGDHKYVVCVSSQAGCALGCTFCATGRLGFRRHLAAWEMVEQVLQVQADSSHPVRGVVFMGMGEPLLNYDAVMTAARIMSEPCGLAIAAKSITISTAGIVPGIQRFTAEHQPYRLVVSLTSADSEVRRTLMPIEQTHSTPALLEALRAYHAVTGERVTLAWTMLAGINTRDADAEMLAKLTHGLPIKLDLIDVNDPSGRFRPPSTEERNTFRDALRKHLAAPVARRYSGGQDIYAACGMLAGGA